MRIDELEVGTKVRNKTTGEVSEITSYCDEPTIKIKSLNVPVGISGCTAQEWEVFNEESWSLMRCWNYIAEEQVPGSNELKVVCRKNDDIRMFKELAEKDCDKLSFNNKNQHLILNSVISTENNILILLKEAYTNGVADAVRKFKDRLGDLK